MMSTPFQICFLKFMWKIYGMHLRSHMQTLLHAPCMHLRSQKGSRAHQMPFWYFLRKFCRKKIEYLNSSQKNVQFQKINHPKWSSGSEVMIILKSTKFQHFFWKRPHGFQNFIQNLFGYYSLQEDKVICVEISMMHILHQIHADIYIFNKIFKEHKLA